MILISSCLAQIFVKRQLSGRGVGGELTDAQTLLKVTFVNPFLQFGNTVFKQLKTVLEFFFKHFQIYRSLIVILCQQKKINYQGCLHFLTPKVQTRKTGFSQMAKV